MASCRDKNDERANVLASNGRWDRTKRSTLLGKRSIHTEFSIGTPRTNVASSHRTQCPLEILAISLQPGYRSILLVERYARVNTRVAVCVCPGRCIVHDRECVHVEHSSYRTERYRIDAFYRARKSVMMGDKE